ncbi:cupredoxin domain-containing protein [Photobacterium sp. Hal280]|uniref:cupredoxin domain-containing protein n=1 Tax=Photobacterium sp. Hal280 TaxID=3035163 RepID=UPI00301BC843
MTKLLKNAALASLLLTSFATLADIPTYELVMKDHQFQPAELTIPAAQKVKLVIKNQDDNAEEFESHALHVEKIIPGNSQGFVILRPLEEGEYKFVGEFHEDKMIGHIIVK